MMKSPAIESVVMLMKSLPEPVQNQVLEHLRYYIEELQDEAGWDTQFEQTQPKLIKSARKSRPQIAEGLSQPLDEMRF